MPFTLLAPSTAEEAIRWLSEPEAPPTAVLAGGTDLLFELADGAPARVLSLRRLPWRDVRWDGPTLVIGSTAPLSDLEHDARVRSEIPGLWAAVRAVGSVPLRHRATLGGNLARAAPASDLIPILLALEARVVVVGPGGRRELSIDSLVKGPRATDLRRAELIEAIRVDEARPSAYLWQRVRPANDISQVGVAAAWSPREAAWRLAAGGAGPAPARLCEAEAALTSPAPSEEELGRAAALASRIVTFATDKRATGEYRRQVLEVLVRRAVRSAHSGPGVP